MKPNNTIMALDIGGRRIGVALTSVVARLPRPLTTLVADDTFPDTLAGLIAEQRVGHLVIGLPRNLSGDDTEQTRTIRTIARTLQAKLPQLSMSFQDEALTSRQAEQELQASGRPYEKADIDALAATYILEDYLRDNPVEVET
jgi:putative Holliday junction resolvase